VFRAIAADLARRGCRIGWRTTPLPPHVPALADVGRSAAP
jgi:hypothetical protein